MKKLLSSLLFVVLCLPVLVKADIGVPFYSQEFIVGNEGTFCYQMDNEKTKLYNPVEIPINTVVEAFYSEDDEEAAIINGRKYFEVRFEVNNKRNFCYVLVSDLFDPNLEYQITERDITERDNVYTGDSRPHLLLTKDKITLYKGPSTIFESEEITVDVNREIEVIASYAGGSWYKWKYIDYDGKKGWVDYLSEQMFETTGSIMIITDGDFKTYDGGKISIPKYTIIDGDSVYTAFRSDLGIFKYNDELVRFNTRDSLDNWPEDDWYTIQYIYEREEDEFILEEDLPLYENASIDSKVLAIVPKGTKFTTNYSGYLERDCTYDTAYLVEYNGQRGFIFIKRIDIEEKSPVENEKIDEIIIDHNSSNIKDKQEPSNTIIYVFLSIVLSLLCIIMVVFIIKRKKVTNKSNLSLEITDIDTALKTTEENKHDVEN